MNIQSDDMALFMRVAELGTLSAAARERNQPVSAVTRALARLEADCGARLMHRSTHGLSLTDEGDTFLAYARQMLDAQAQLQADLNGKLAGPSGWVRVSVSAVLGEAVIAPSLPSLYERHPALHLDIGADDRMVDMAREGIDLAIRTGHVASEALVARQIGRLQRGLYAAPAYAARFGLPLTVAELGAHRLIANSASPGLNRWPLNDPPPEPAGEDPRASSQLNTPTPRAIRPHTRTDNTAMTLALARHGVGIARIVTLAAEPLVRSGELLPVLAGQLPSNAVPMFAVMLQERHRLPKVRACIEHWAAWMAQNGD